MSVEATPRVSSHAEFRFLQRTGLIEVSPDAAWRAGTPVTVDGYDYSKARYDPILDVVLLARDGIVTTVLKAAYTDFTEANQ